MVVFKENAKFANPIKHGQDVRFSGYAWGPYLVGSVPS